MLLENKPADWLFVEDNAVAINLVFHKDKNYQNRKIYFNHNDN
jgi:dTDP-D-glucose 4,6-dehydratase